MRKIIIIINLFLPVLLTSCISGPRDVEFFYLGDGKLQYFLTSRWWTTEEKDKKLEADWLYRTYTLPGEEGGPRTVLNFSLYSKTTSFRKKPEQVVLSAGSLNIVIPGAQIDLIYIDQGKTRFSTWFLSAEMEVFMAAASGGASFSVQVQQPLVFNSSRQFLDQVSYFQEVILGM